MAKWGISAWGTFDWGSLAVILKLSQVLLSALVDTTSALEGQVLDAVALTALEDYSNTLTALWAYIVTLLGEFSVAVDETGLETPNVALTSLDSTIMLAAATSEITLNAAQDITTTLLGSMIPQVVLTGQEQ